MLPRAIRGIRFERAAAPVDRVLPRMDIAGFVGLATAGPIDMPVAIENTGQFAEIFGLDLRVSTGAGPERRSFLGACVRTFFANGGRRCWVVRVAGTAPRSARFTLPGIYSAVLGQAATPAASVQLIARSPGSWSEAVQVAVSPRRRGLRLRSCVWIRDGAWLSLCARLHGDDPLLPGELLALDIDGQRCFAATESVTSTDGGRVVTTTPLVFTTGPLVRSTESPTTIAAMGGDPILPALIAEVWSFDLHTRTSQQSRRTLKDLGFHPLHPRHWRRLPDDLALFSNDFEPTSLAREATAPRLPVAGTPDTGWETPGPDFAESAWSGPDAEPLQSLTPPRWVRDGLTSFEPGMLIDDAMATASLTRLLPLADELRYIHPKPRGLRGVHALLAVDEVTLVALPDLVQAPWTISGVASSPLLELGPAAAGFVPCGPDSLAAPTWSLPAPERPTRLSWADEVPPQQPRTYRLERASDPDFLTAATVLVGPDHILELDLVTPVEAWLRVRAEQPGRAGPWSRILHLRVFPGPALVDHPAPTDPAVVQRAVLRMCAARGDLTAVLVGPDQPREALATHAQTLRAWTDHTGDPPISPLAFDERRALSHGGLWGPWLLVREPDGELRSVPADGAVAGFIAHRTLVDGAWLAAANLPVREVIGPSHALDDAQASALLAVGVQPLRREPWGLVSLGAATLADPDSEVQQLHVRRLLALLRRLALRHGQDWVFEPQGPAFVRAVESSFEAVLRQLYTRGAFAGDRPETAYAVRVQPDPDASERGRFVVELRIAPAQPLRFLTVRLLQDEIRGLTAEGA